MTLARKVTSPRTPDWVVTYGDMMSLLLTFFVMLIAMNVDRDQPASKAVLASIQQRFGAAGLRTRNATPTVEAAVAHLARTGRARRHAALSSGASLRLPLVEVSLPETRGPKPAASLAFGSQSSQLTPEHKASLDAMLTSLDGATSVEVHAAVAAGDAHSPTPHPAYWDLAYARSASTMSYLVEQGVDAANIRITVTAQPRRRVPSALDAQQEVGCVEVFALARSGAAPIAK
jgi:chemotaxis protein MotB